MGNLKNDIISIIITIIAYITLIFLLSINENIVDVIFVVGFATIMISSLLSLFKVNLKKIKYFIWLNITVFIITCLYNSFIYNRDSLFTTLFILILTQTFLVLRYSKKNKQNK